MYGTIARFHVKPGKLEELKKLGQEHSDALPSLAFEYIFQSDNDPNEHWIVVGFESREAYKANADSPEQHQRFLALRELMDAEPEWHDGEIIDSYTG